MNWKLDRKIRLGLLSLLVAIEVLHGFGLLEGQETLVILGVILILASDVIGQRDLIEKISQDLVNMEGHIKEDIKRINYATLEIITREKAGLVTDVEAENVFEDFSGIFWAFNAPLVYDLGGEESRINSHISRYRQPDFKSYYLYPIFAHPNTETKNQWASKVKEFWKELSDSGELNEDEKMKAVFFVPKKSFQYSQDFNITYFVGKKAGKEQAIIYIYHPIFTNMDLRLPKKMLIVYDPETIKEISQYIQSTRIELEKKEGIESFLRYMNANFPNV